MALTAGLEADGVSVGQTGRWFLDKPLYDAEADKTFVLIKMWGRTTEPTFAALVERFRDAGVSVRRADPE